MLVKLGYSYKAWCDGLQVPFLWDTEKDPHLLIAGITGGSKTVSSQMIVNQLLEQKKDLKIADYKAGGDWDNIISDYAEYADCDNLFDSFYESFVETIRKKEHEEKYLLFDEFSSYALSKDAKEFKNLMAKVSHIAFMGRSYGYHLLIIGQQISCKVMDSAIREQFGIKMYMGSTISTESATMLFPNCEIDKSFHLPRYCGYISMPERDLDIIQMPFLSDASKLKLLLEKKGREYYQ